MGVPAYETLFDGREIARIGLGTWRMGGGMSPDPSRDERALTALRAALEMGYAHIDTAEMYAGGRTEELIGRVLGEFRREAIFLTSKAWSSHLRAAEVLRACQGSLRRLGTDYLDLYLIHWPNPRVPLEETLGAMNELVERGFTRYIGVSNFSLELLRQARSLSTVPLAVNQVPYNLRQTEASRNGVLEYSRKHKLLLTAYSPIGEGRLAGGETLERVAGRYGVSPAQLALHWLVRQPGVIAIPMSTNSAHLQANLEALDLGLAEEDLQILDRMAGLERE